jgi:hypothetical protein
VIFYRSASGKCPIEEFVEDLPVRRVKKAKTLRKDYFKRAKGGENG